MLSILVVDDNRSSADALTRILQKQGHEVEAVYDGSTAITLLNRKAPQLVLTDLKMEPVGGMEVLAAARASTPPIEVIVFTAFGAVETAVVAMQMGARDFLTKPVSVDQILDRIRQITGESSPDVDPDAPMIAQSVQARALLQTLRAVADVPSPVWIEGELGSGRQRAASLIHELGTDPSTITIVDPTSDDAWPTAGTLVLPAVDDLDDTAQQALARRLKTLQPGVRLIATARPQGRRRVNEGKLRSDLYFALAVVIVEVPPLRDRTEDIQALFFQSLQRFCEKYGRPVPEVDEERLGRLLHHGWPGNTRELFNLAERTAVLGIEGFNLEPSGLAASVSEVAGGPILEPGFRLSAYLERIERGVLEQALRLAKGDRNAAGRLLGVERNTLRYKLNKYGLLS